MNDHSPQFDITVAFSNPRDTFEVTAKGFKEATKRADFERERYPEAVITITPGW
jgi:hypothetical protein